MFCTHFGHATYKNLILKFPTFTNQQNAPISIAEFFLQIMFKQKWHEIKTWNYLELITSTKRAKCFFLFFIFYNLASYQNKRVVII